MDWPISRRLPAAVAIVLIGGFFYWSACASQEPVGSAESESTASSQQNQEILFRVKVSDTGLQSQWLAEGNQLTDFLEARLPGKLYDPPLRFGPVERAAAKRETPLDAAVSDFSAFKADEGPWILENFAPEQREGIGSLLNNPDAREMNRKIFESQAYRSVTGEARYEEYALVFVQDGETAPVRPLAFKKGPNGLNWLRTNELSDDGIYDIVFSALGADEGEVRVAE